MIRSYDIAVYERSGVLVAKCNIHSHSPSSSVEDAVEKGLLCLSGVYVANVTCQSGMEFSFKVSIGLG